MRRYTCDVCGKNMPAKYERSNGRRSGLASVCKVDDVCEKCLSVAKGVDVEGIVLAAWRTIAAEANPLRGHDPDLPTGRSKSDVMDRLQAYRKREGLGCLKPLAKLAGGEITDDLLRDVINGAASLSTDQWRRLGNALEKLEGPNE